jgi:putative transposase
VAAHVAGEDDALINVAPMLERHGPVADFPGDTCADQAAWKGLRMSETSGRPLGSDEWIGMLEKKTGRPLKPQKREPKVMDKWI